MGSLYRSNPKFTPVVMFTDNTPTDNLAIAQLHVLQAEIRRTMDTERSKQQTIGISEIGNPCRRCVALKLSGLYPKPHDPSWRAQVGTSIHTMLEDHFAAAFADHIEWSHDDQKYQVNPDAVATDEKPLYHLERRVKVFAYKGLDLGGSCDMFIQGATYGIVDDWKTQGTDKLLKKTAKGDIGETYLVQMMTYGFGYELLGYNVTHVVLYALPRDNDLDNAKPVLMRYNRQVAIDAFARLATMIDAAEIVGWETVIESQPRATPCWDCDRFDAQITQGFVAGLTA